MACAIMREVLCVVRFQKISAPALKTCTRLMREGSELGKMCLSRALLDIHQSKPLTMIMKEPVELEPLRKIDEIRNISKKKKRA